MISLYETLCARRAELLGHMASGEEIERLASRLHEASCEPLVRIYRELPICGADVEFVVDDQGIASSPRPDYIASYDSLYDHAFDWKTPTQIIDETDLSVWGPPAFAAGFMSIGMCVFGGDNYYLDLRSASATDVPLYKVYHDWVHPDDEVPVPPQALHLVAHSFAQVLKVARISRGL